MSQVILGGQGTDIGGERKFKRENNVFLTFGLFKLPLAPTICPWVSKDGLMYSKRKLSR